MANAQDMLQWQGRKMVDSSGEKVGKIEEIFVDNDTDQPEWALVNTGLFGTAATFVPLAQADERGEDVVVPFDKATVKDAPTLERDRELSRDDEAELYRYYDLDQDAGGGSAPDAARGGDDTGRHATADGDLSGPETDAAMTRSEEELHVGTQSRESGRARLRKHIVTEQVTENVPVRHEELRVTREPITEDNAAQANAGAELTEEEHEVTLHEEVPTVDKRTVAKERVRMDADTVTENEQVSEEVRKEQIEVDDAVQRR